MSEPLLAELLRPYAVRPAVATRETPVPVRLAARIDYRGDDQCWEWRGAIDDGGYGSLRIKQRTHRAHRLVYELLVGAIPNGLELDHLCRNRACCNPAHLEPVTKRENALRGISPMAQLARATHCVNGHPFDETNTGRASTRPGRICLTCRRRRARGYYWARKAAA